MPLEEALGRGSFRLFAPIIPEPLLLSLPLFKVSFLGTFCEDLLFILELGCPIIALPEFLKTALSYILEPVPLRPIGGLEPVDNAFAAALFCCKILIPGSAGLELVEWCAVSDSLISEDFFEISSTSFSFTVSS